MGKGTAPRPYSVSRKDYEDKWEQTFGKRKHETDSSERKERPENAGSGVRQVPTKD